MSFMIVKRLKFRHLIPEKNCLTECNSIYKKDPCIISKSEQLIITANVPPWIDYIMDPLPFLDTWLIHILYSRRMAKYKYPFLARHLRLLQIAVWWVEDVRHLENVKYLKLHVVNIAYILPCEKLRRNNFHYLII